MNQDSFKLLVFFLPVYTAYEGGTDFSVTSAPKIQTPGIRPKERIKPSKQGESVKYRIYFTCYLPCIWSQYSPQQRQ
jgi:hypothetical protein